ncbi:hypothetical protein [Klenkia taihuensis]|uniref:Uncharacterized protein n=1 Tax=Klenkia taihuensis TaxID=1225127 RepID=A0A1I1NS89_9ACTN|nr:hypothetical protein [Klenkia taihuensis]GHE11907.1 hypothetical protein GCM10011381_27430 [Klenkia taihuensis]SFC97633.1 hypothetical protein SAMN05661030_2146 [Klenkia taihuensis]
MHPALARALEPVLRDLRTSGGPLPRVVDQDWTGDPGSPSLYLWDDAVGTGLGGGTGVRIDLHDDADEQALDLAGQVQEWAWEALAGTHRSNWPVCPAHPTTHPMDLAVRDGQAGWACPRGGPVRARLGELVAES